MDARATRYLSPRARSLAGLAIGGFAVYIAVTLAFLLLRPDLDPLRRVMSNYAVGPDGALMGVAFIASGAAALAMAILVLGVRARDRWARLGARLIALAGIGLFVAALFPTDVNPADTPVTQTGTIHVAAGIVTFLSLTVGCVALSHLAWRRPAATLAVAIVVIAFIAFFVGVALDLRGAGQRLFVYTAFVWLAAAAYQLGWKRR